LQRLLGGLAKSARAVMVVIYYNILVQLSPQIKPLLPSTTSMCVDFITGSHGVFPTDFRGVELQVSTAFFEFF
jgi:hypothetical protein